MIEHTINIDRMDQTMVLFGNLDCNINALEKEYHVAVVNRENTVKISGEPENVMLAARAVEAMVSMINRGESLDPQSLRYLFSLVASGDEKKLESLSNEVICITSTGKPVKGKTLGQREYVEAMRKNPVVFGIGPAGTGKTYLAVAMAVRAFKNHDINRIILTRPAVEAGEKLGFLPGDLLTKVDPYLRPLYDALFDMIGADNYQKYLERGNIEVAPLAYMRGRTLDDSFIILDEAQNTTPEQMKMFLTRFGANSRAVITGDITQIDLLEPKKSGLLEAIKVLRSVEDIGICRLTQKDVVRHVLVQRIINAYEKYSEKNIGDGRRTK
jgi:phosphate starvation-inducible PhoH-like protein